MRDRQIHPYVEKRRFRVKNPKTSFFCPLCSMEREINYSPKLEPRHYVQIIVISGCLMALTASTMGAWSLVFLFVTWASFEAGLRTLFKKEIPCPHCGFDATWYKRDVKVARKKVKEFWDRQMPVTSEEPESTELEEPPEEEAAYQETYS